MISEHRNGNVKKQFPPGRFNHLHAPGCLRCASITPSHYNLLDQQPACRMLFARSAFTLCRRLAVAIIIRLSGLAGCCHCHASPGNQDCSGVGGIVLAEKEKHRTGRIGWLRAAVLGANDGILSTASLVVGVASADATRGNVLIAGVAGLVAGGMSMAAGEYVSVSSQADTENADLAVERNELAADQEGELEELAEIYVTRGLDRSFATEVARQLMAHDALAAHARDELGISDVVTARPVQAALTSAFSFAVGAALPLITISVSPERSIVPLVAITALVFLALLGTVAARIGGASMLKGAVRVTFWGAFAMAVTAGVGTLFRLAS